MRASSNSPQLPLAAPRVNLLPAGYAAAARRHHRHFRFALAVGWRAHLCGADRRGCRSRPGRAGPRARCGRRPGPPGQRGGPRDSTQPRQEADRLGLEVRLAQRLRAKHRWSRLLGLCPQITPQRAMLTSVSTNPPQWLPNVLGNPAGAADSGSPGRAVPAADGRARAGAGGRSSGPGRAHDRHSDLGHLRVLSILRHARREKVGQQESIFFELECHW